MTKIIQIEGQEATLGNIFCIGRNYSEHVKELHNAKPDEPVVFLKPTSSLAQSGDNIKLPSYSRDVHHECELVIYIKEDAIDVDEDKALNYVGGYAIGLDLTARDVQTELKNKGLPWEKAKGFPTAACVSHFIAPEKVGDIQTQDFCLKVNGEIRQQGNSRDMIFSCRQIISYLSRVYGLQAGDIIYTGTPEGVAAIKSGDELELIWPEKVKVKFQVI
ncbi:isomerase/hydrolase [Snodgrassella alvi]|jgi:2-keto-4-pentenoate hydratase/2-oxohepta-3-ene-1,7-dioic acid hydratase in catechol pathway|uniref:fumarylacetoacetate hydrolase family protein n=1 Tax=Snodgrassella alvi TaxID=1196083 RepID=UPI000C1E3712|nr:fumarylacetoacetate hydrolase family protein [Snodgrassella alvi]PIT13943.1 isomerase/hydrolase [Snodgrassella alvi]PIT56592.1 isomerase/hydrolase [Snodgrassella alvi]